MLLARSFCLGFKLNMVCTAQHSCHASAHVSPLQAGVAIFRSAAWPISGTEAHRATVQHANFLPPGWRSCEARPQRQGARPSQSFHRHGRSRRPPLLRDHPLRSQQFGRRGCAPFHVFQFLTASRHPCLRCLQLLRRLSCRVAQRTPVR